MAEKITLKIAGKEYADGWDDVQVNTSMDALSISFSFSATQKVPFDMSKWDIQMGSECTVQIGGDLLATGFIEDVDIEYAKDSHTVRVAGRDKLSDLVDCCIAGDVFSWKNARGVDIVRSLVKPYGIIVTVDKSAQSRMNERLTPVGVQGGDGVFDTLAKVIKLAGAVGIALPDGGLLITNTGTLRADDMLVSGKNVLTGALKQSNRERFQWYFVKGYDYSIDSVNTRKLAYFSKFEDKGINRFRATALTVESYGDFRAGVRRAEWEARFRAGKSRKYGYTVRGWRQSTGKLWDINMLVGVTDPYFGLGRAGTPAGAEPIPTELLINSIQFVQSGSQGTMSHLELVSPEKWKAQAQLDKIRALSDGMQTAAARRDIEQTKQDKR